MQKKGEFLGELVFAALNRRVYVVKEPIKSYGL
jgi:hypothetical protein